MNNDYKMNVNAIDLFCGIGGLSNGLLRAGISIIAGIDIDESCRYAYESNNNAKFINKNVDDIEPEYINWLYKSNESEIKILVGCAPCQPFSKYSNNKSNRVSDIYEDKWGLLYSFSRLIKSVKPDIISMENVPEIINEVVFQDFVNTLTVEGYNFSYKVVYAPDYGVPQSRKRLLLLASRFGNIELISPTCCFDNYVTVRDAIGDLVEIEAGEKSNIDELHFSSKLSEKNLKRIKQSKPGGTWKDWDKNLLAKCHLKKSGQSYKSVYGRMQWDRVSPTITTQFNGYGNGRFGHPEQNRALSLREGALLQSFPRDYKFVKPGDPFTIKSIATQIGNAVPVRLGEIVGESIQIHIKDYIK